MGFSGQATPGYFRRCTLLASFAAIVVCILVILTPLAEAAEEETHLFNAVLSLTGDCGSTGFDPVPDPGCPAGEHPSGSFANPRGLALDSHGDRYVASYGSTAGDGSNGRVDIFGPSGEFITELATPGVTSLAIDGDGNLYLGGNGNPGLVRYTPTVYNPQAGEIEYGDLPVTVFAEKNNGGAPLINPVNDRVFLPRPSEHGWIEEYGSAAEGNVLLDKTIGQDALRNPYRVAVDAARKRIYATTTIEKAGKGVAAVRVLDLDPPHAVLATIDGSTTPAGGFLSTGSSSVAVAIEEATGDLFVGELGLGVPRIYEFEADGSYVSTIKPAGMQPIADSQIAVDNSVTSPTLGYLFAAASGAVQPGRSLAFEPNTSGPPAIESVSVSGVSEDEALLEATVDPHGEPTDYRFEYVSEQSFEESGFAGAHLAGGGSIASSGEGVSVSQPATGLQPATRYRFRVVAENESGEDEALGAFATYGLPDESEACPNAALRSGGSAGLPDCRAYELVTPSNTNGRVPEALPASARNSFIATRPASPTGEKVSFATTGGAIPGLGGTGSLHGDPYLATRGGSGWNTAYIGPSGFQAPFVLHSSISPDQGYSLWGTGSEGSAAVDGKGSTYLRYPDGHSELVGRGSLGVDPGAETTMISENGGHVIFSTTDQVRKTAAVQLEPDAPPDGTIAIYDRTSDEVTHVVSLLPGEVTPAAGEDARHLGASFDGRAVAFTVGNALSSPIYLRVDNAETFLAAPAGATFAGLAEGGKRLFYLDDGDLYAFDAESESIVAFTESAAKNGSGHGDVAVTNVSAEGTVAYVISPSLLSGEGNPNGELPVKGAYNLYLSEEGTIRFVARVSDLDVGETKLPGEQPGDLAGWVNALKVGGTFGNDPSRTTPDGSVFVFESRAGLSEYDSEGRAQVYRFDAAAETLRCVSCSPTMAKSLGNAKLNSLRHQGASEEPVDKWTLVNALRADGRRVFFESPDPLVASDTDRLQDVYEWEDKGVGSCRSEGGCIYLISSGRSALPNYLYAVSDSGNDVFFSTADLLLPDVDPDETPSIYDARVNGGFPPPAVASGECLGEACQPAAVAPDDPTPASSSFEGKGNVGKETSTRARCPKGKRLTRHAGKRRCVPKHGKNRNRANTKGRAQR